MTDVVPVALVAGVGLHAITLPVGFRHSSWVNVSIGPIKIPISALWGAGAAYYYHKQRKSIRTGDYYDMFLKDATVTLAGVTTTAVLIEHISFTNSAICGLAVYLGGLLYNRAGTIKRAIREWIANEQ